MDKVKENCIQMKICNIINVLPVEYILIDTIFIAIYFYPIRLNRLLVFRNCARQGIICSCSSSLALCKLSFDE